MSSATRVRQTHNDPGSALTVLRSTDWRKLLRGTMKRFNSANGFIHSRSVAYGIALTALPATIAAVGLATALEGPNLRHVLQQTLQSLAPGAASRTLTQAFSQGSDAGSGSWTVLLIGIGATITSGTAAMAQIEQGANRIYGLDRDRSLVRRYAVAFFLTCTAGFFIALAFTLFVAGEAVRQAGEAGGGWSDNALFFWDIARWPLTLVLIAAAFALIFRFAPRRKQPTRSWLWSGAAASVILWCLFTGGLSLYLNESREFGQTYGPLAGMIGMLIWAFLTSVAILAGVAVTAELEAQRVASRSSGT